MPSSYIVRPSKIHGLGLFAARTFERGEVIGVYEGARTRTDGTHVLWIVGDDGREFGIDGINALRFVNHSSEPNCMFEGPELTALQRIPRGRELTCHYGDDWR